MLLFTRHVDLKGPTMWIAWCEEPEFHRWLFFEDLCQLVPILQQHDEIGCLRLLGASEQDSSYLYSGLLRSRFSERIRPAPVFVCSFLDAAQFRFLVSV